MRLIRKRKMENTWAVKRPGAIAFKITTRWVMAKGLKVGTSGQRVTDRVTYLQKTKRPADKGWPKCLICMVPAPRVELGTY